MRVELFNIRIRFGWFSVEKLVKVTGINSNFDDENKYHILMWDFDDTPLDKIVDELLFVQHFWELPSIHIVSSSPEHYHAYCFSKQPTPVVLHILSATPSICKNYFKLGVIRGYWTLRISPEKGEFKKELILQSNIPEYLDGLNKLCTVKYDTRSN